MGHREGGPLGGLAAIRILSTPSCTCNAWSMLQFGFVLHIQYVVHVHVSVTLPCTLHVAIIMLPRELHVSSSPGSKLWGW